MDDQRKFLLARLTEINGLEAKAILAEWIDGVLAAESAYFEEGSAEAKRAAIGQALASCIQLLDSLAGDEFMMPPQVFGAPLHALMDANKGLSDPSRLFLPAERSAGAPKTGELAALVKHRVSIARKLLVSGGLSPGQASREVAMILNKYRLARLFPQSRDGSVTERQVSAWANEPNPERTSMVRAVAQHLTVENQIGAAKRVMETTAKYAAAALPND